MRRPLTTMLIARPVVALAAVVFLAGPLRAGQLLLAELEPNSTSATATALGGTNLVVRANLDSTTDVDYFRLVAPVAGRLYAATMTQGSPTGTDSILAVLASDGATVVETDDDDGTLSMSSSSIAGASLPPGSYYLRVSSPSGLLVQPYDLHLRFVSDAPVSESEPNDNRGAPQALPAGGWVAGALASGGDQDWYSLTLAAAVGDSVFVSLDLDPERDAVEWGGALHFGPCNSAAFPGAFNDLGVGTPDSEALMATIHVGGAYCIGVSSVNGTFGTYHLSVAVRPADPSCGTDSSYYTTTDVPRTISSDELTLSTLTIPGNAQIDDLDIDLQLTHHRPADLDATLTSPTGNEVVLFRGDVRALSDTFALSLDDEAAAPLRSVPSFGDAQQIAKGRMRWFDGQDQAGNWTLKVHDRQASEDGTLDGWSLRVCAPADCTPTTLWFEHTFETPPVDFTAPGAGNEWEFGVPNPLLFPIASCYSGSCFKTDLDGEPDSGIDHDLISPAIALSSARDTVLLRWRMAYQLDSASLDEAWVDVRWPDHSHSRRVWRHRDAAMSVDVGSPSVSVQESAGWARYEVDISDYAGQTIEVVFHVRNGSVSGSYLGMAIDDMAVVQRGECFHSLPPCRVLDTRIAGFGPALTHGVARALDLRQACGVPLDAKAVSVNLTATEASQPGSLTFYQSAPTTATFLDFAAGSTRANNAVIGLAPRGASDIQVRATTAPAGGSVHLVLDVNGYWE